MIQTNNEVVYEIISRLRNPSTSLVYAERGVGKTTTLVQYIAERTLLTAPNSRIFVIVPTLGMGSTFVETFKKSFPTLQIPSILTPTSYLTKYLSAIHKDAEIYLDEFELLDKGILSHLRAVRHLIKGGVSSPKSRVNGIPVEAFI